MLTNSPDYVIIITEREREENKMVTIYWTNYTESVTYKRFFELIDEVLAEGWHITSTTNHDKKSKEPAFMVCFW